MPLEMPLAVGESRTVTYPVTFQTGDGMRNTVDSKVTILRMEDRYDDMYFKATLDSKLKGEALILLDKLASHLFGLEAESHSESWDHVHRHGFFRIYRYTESERKEQKEARDHAHALSTYREALEHLKTVRGIVRSPQFSSTIIEDLLLKAETRIKKDFGKYLVEQELKKPTTEE